MKAMPAYSAADIEMLLAVSRQELGTAEISDGIQLDDDRRRGLLAAALDHGLIGPLYQAASKTPGIPLSIRTAYLAQAARNFQLTIALGEILRSFAEYAIEVIVFKGPAVAVMAYGQITCREFTDLDLLVRPGDIDRARFVLRDLAYRQISEGVQTDPNQKDIQFLRDEDRTLVELHWAFNPPNNRFPLEATGIWSRVQIANAGAVPIPTLGIEDTLIYLCLHAAKHRWISLKWTFDIARILTCKAAALDWDSLLQRCTAVGCNRTLFFGAYLAHLLFGVTLPAALAAQTAMYPSLMTLGEAVRDSLLQSTLLSESDRIKCAVEIHDRLGDRLFTAALPFPDLPRALPAALSPITSGPLRFLTRPIRLLGMYGFAWFRTAIVGR
jgi:hypothetical protein